MTSLVRVYKQLLHQHPFPTNVLTTCTFMVTGDITSQLMIARKDQLDLRQTARFAVAGLIFVGPVVRGCLVMIDKLFGPTKSMAVLARKLFLDQCIIAPAFLVGNITTLTLLKSQSFTEVKKELDRSYFSLLKLNYSFWPFVQVINFYYIPLAYRVLFGSTAALAWNIMFSYNLYNKRRKH